MNDFDTGLVDHHVTKVHQLAARAALGENVGEELGATVAEAVDHFGRVFNPVNQLEAYIGRLKFGADLTAETQPRHAEVLREAARMAARPLPDAD